MKFFRPAGRMEAEADTLDWPREHGYAKTSRFSFPDLYLSDDVAQLAEADPAVSVFLRQCLTQFVCHEYGHLASMDLAENYINRDIKGTFTWVRGNYPSPKWGEISLDVFYDLGLFHREGTPPRTLAIAQHRKESETHEP